MSCRILVVFSLLFFATSSFAQPVNLRYLAMLAAQSETNVTQIPDSDSGVTVITIDDVLNLPPPPQEGFFVCCDLMEIPASTTHDGGFGLDLLKYREGACTVSLGAGIVDTDVTYGGGYQPDAALCFTLSYGF